MGMACMEIFMVIIKREFEADFESPEKCKKNQNSCRPKTFAQKPASNSAFFDTHTAFLKIPIF
jgi:hypothetical protein